MKKTQKNILAVAGVISIVFGLMCAIPSFLDKYEIVGVAVILVVAGLIILAIAFGD